MRPYKFMNTKVRSGIIEPNTFSDLSDCYRIISGHGQSRAKPDFFYVNVFYAVRMREADISMHTSKVSKLFWYI